MSRLTRISFSLWLTLLFLLQSQAYATRQAKPGDTPAQAMAEGRAPTVRALALLDQLLDASGSFEDAHLRLKVQSEVADLLWSHDQQRARRLFEEALRGAGAMRLSHLEPIPGQPFLDSVKSSFRGDILKMIYRHDRALAESLAKSTEPPQTNPSEAPAALSGAARSVSAEQQLQVALYALDTAPTRAARLAKESMDKGINPMVTTVLELMRRKDAALADEVFLYALSAARRQGLFLSGSFGALYRYVLPDFGGGAPKQADALRVSPPNPALVAEFLSFVHDAIVREAEAMQARQTEAATPSVQQRMALDYFTGQQLLIYFDRYLPDKAAAARAALEDLIRLVPPDTAKQYLDEINRQFTAAALFKRGEVEDKPELQQNYYQQAIARASHSDDYEQAFPLLAKLDDEAVRAYWDSQLRQRRVQTALMKRDTEAAYQSANEIPYLSARATMLGRIALQFFYEKNAPRARQVLAEAETLFARAEGGVERARGMLELVYAAMQIDPERGFADMQSAVAAINAAGFTPRYMDFKDLLSPKTGKRIMGVEVGIGSLDFLSVFGGLARNDFDRSLKLARMIGLKETSVLAQLAVCRTALD